MLAFADVMHLFADELTRLAGGTLPLALGLPRPLERLFLRHGSPPSIFLVVSRKTDACEVQMSRRCGHNAPAAVLVHGIAVSSRYMVPIAIQLAKGSWPTTWIAERHAFQHGALGGATPDEYLRGSPRVEAYLRRYRVSRRRWDSPLPDGSSPEAEWGFGAA
jgi:hypothetical protein